MFNWRLLSIQRHSFRMRVPCACESSLITPSAHSNSFVQNWTKKCIFDRDTSELQRTKQSTKMDAFGQKSHEIFPFSLDSRITMFIMPKQRRDFRLLPVLGLQNTRQHSKCYSIIFQENCLSFTFDSFVNFPIYKNEPMKNILLLPLTPGQVTKIKKAF